MCCTQELLHFLENSADFFRQLSVRRHFKWLLAWFSATAHTNIWRSRCPLGLPPIILRYIEDNSITNEYLITIIIII